MKKQRSTYIHLKQDSQKPRKGELEQEQNEKTIKAKTKTKILLALYEGCD